jgi:hypothetical protein
VLYLKADQSPEDLEIQALESKLEELKKKKALSLRAFFVLIKGILSFKRFEKQALQPSDCQVLLHIFQNYKLAMLWPMWTYDYTASLWL